MSPSVDDFQREIGRDVAPGDILFIANNGGYIDSPSPAHYQIDKAHVIGVRKRLFGLLGKETADCVEVRKLTEFGPMIKRLRFSRKEDLFDSLIRREDRIEKAPMRER